MAVLARPTRFLVAAAIVAALLYALNALAAWLWRPDVAGRLLARVEAGGLPFYLPFLVVLLIALLLLPQHVRAPWRWSRATLTPVNVALLVLIVIVPAVLNALSWKGTFRLPTPSVAMFSGVVICPIVEEWIFRGVLWRAALGDERSPRLAAVAATLVATSVAFGFWHLPFKDHAPIAAHAAFGLAMGVLRWRFQSLLPGALVHAANNSTYFFVH